MTLELDAERVTLDLADTFTISRGSTDVAENVVVTVTDTDSDDVETDGDLTGVGAAAPSAHYGETADTVEAVLPAYADAIADVELLRRTPTDAGTSTVTPRFPGRLFADLHTPD
jgi:hypothetical protein